MSGTVESIELEKIIKVTPPGQKLFVPPDKSAEYILKILMQVNVVKAVFDSEDIGNFDFLDSTRKFYHGMTNKGPTHTPEPRRMAKCVKCGKVKNRILFKSYNADNPNMGICSECYSKSKSSNQ